MSRVRVKVINLKMLIVYLLMIIFSIVVALSILELVNYYFKLERTKNGVYSDSKTTTYLENTFEMTLPAYITCKNAISFSDLFKVGSKDCLKDTFGSTMIAFDPYKENEEATEQAFNENEKKLYPVVPVKDAVKNKDKNASKVKADIKESEADKINNELNNNIKAVHSKADVEKNKIKFYKEDESILGNPNDQVTKVWNPNLGNNDKPQILIFHTHNRESFAKSSKYNIPYTDVARTTNNNYNVVRVGEEISNKLREQGYNVIHYTGDNEGSMGITGAYERARKTINEYLKKYPSIKVVLDIHRDSAYDNGQYLKFITKEKIGNCAQVMIDVSSDYYRYGNNPPKGWRDWHQNLTFGAKLQMEMNNLYPGIMRGMCISRYTYNQDIMPNCITLEVGTNSNTLDETLLSADCIGSGLAKLLKENSR